jgi:hypothetical protein
VRDYFLDDYFLEDYFLEDYCLEDYCLEDDRPMLTVSDNESDDEENHLFLYFTPFSPQCRDNQLRSCLITATPQRAQERRRSNRASSET